MSAVITTYEDIVNAALAKLKAPIRVGSLQEGSAPTKIALDTIGQTRDRLLREGDWGFAQREVDLVLLKAAPAGGYINVAWSPVTHPPLPWKYAYTYPADCLKVRSIRGQPSYVPDFDPRPVSYQTPNTYNGSTAVKCIACSVANAVLTYTAQILDPTQWEASFCQLMIDAMADVLAPSVDPQMQQVEKVDEQIQEQRANVTQG